MSSGPEAGDGGAVEPATSGRRTSVERIRAMADPVEAYAEAGKLIDDQQAGRGEAAQLRAEMVRRIWKSREMSLADLARHTRTSRTRAHQLLNASAEEQEEP